MRRLCYNRYDFHDWGNTDTRGKQHAPNDLDRHHVKEMAAKGATWPMVAGVLSIEGKCLRRYYRKELDGGAVQADVAVPTTCFASSPARDRAPSLRRYSGLRPVLAGAK